MLRTKNSERVWLDTVFGHEDIKERSGDYSYFGSSLLFCTDEFLCASGRGCPIDAEMFFSQYRGRTGGTADIAAQ